MHGAVSEFFFFGIDNMLVRSRILLLCPFICNLFFSWILFDRKEEGTVLAHEHVTPYCCSAFNNYSIGPSSPLVQIFQEQQPSRIFSSSHNRDFCLGKLSYPKFVCHVSYPVFFFHEFFFSFFIPFRNQEIIQKKTKHFIQICSRFHVSVSFGPLA